MKTKFFLHRFIWATSCSFLVACSTTPSLDSRFGDSLKAGKKAQQLPVRNQDDFQSVVGSDELKHALDSYLKSQPKDLKDTNPMPGSGSKPSN